MNRLVNQFDSRTYVKLEVLQSDLQARAYYAHIFLLTAFKSLWMVV